MTYYTAIKYNKNRKLHLPDFVVDILGPENFQSPDLTEAFHWLLDLANGTAAFHWLLDLQQHTRLLYSQVKIYPKINSLLSQSKTIRESRGPAERCPEQR